MGRVGHGDPVRTRLSEGGCQGKTPISPSTVHAGDGRNAPHTQHGQLNGFVPATTTCGQDETQPHRVRYTRRNQKEPSNTYLARAAPRRRVVNNDKRVGLARRIDDHLQLLRAANINDKAAGLHPCPRRRRPAGGAQRRPPPTADRRSSDTARDEGGHGAVCGAGKSGWVKRGGMRQANDRGATGRAKSCGERDGGAQAGDTDSDFERPVGRRAGGVAGRWGVGVAALWRCQGRPRLHEDVAERVPERGALSTGVGSQRDASGPRPIS